MSRKVSKTVSLNNDLWRKLKKWGYEPSDVFEIACELLLSDDMDFYNHEFRLHLERRKLQQKELDIKVLKEQFDSAQLAYEKALNEYEDMNDIYKEMQQQYENIQLSLERGKLLSNINDIAIKSGYDILVVSATCKEWIDKLQMLDETFDVVEHVNALKMLMN